MDSILRAWTFWIHAHREAECRDDMERMVFSRMRQAPGNQHANAVFRDAGDGTLEVIVLSIWDSMANIQAFTGPQFLKPVISPTLLSQVVDCEPSVHHYAMTDFPASLQEWLSL